MNLKNFANLVEPKICNRGFHYYEGGAIDEIEQVAKREFSATVDGSEEYTVFIKLDKDLNILDHSCDCPYDWGNICKHEVAVMYHIKYNQLYNQPLAAGLFGKMQKDLQKLDKKELVEILLNLSKKNKTVREDIKWELGYEE